MHIWTCTTIIEIFSSPDRESQSLVSLILLFFFYSTYHFEKSFTVTIILSLVKSREKENVLYKKRNSISALFTTNCFLSCESIKHHGIAWKEISAVKPQSPILKKNRNYYTCATMKFIYTPFFYWEIFILSSVILKVKLLTPKTQILTTNINFSSPKKELRSKFKHVICVY